MTTFNLSIRCSLLLGLCLTQASGAAEANGTSFFDDFDRLDTAFWYVSDGWSNGDHQNCGWSAKEISISGGMLNVGFSETPAADNRRYRCGEIQTNQTFGYGTYEARLKTPAGSGLNAAFFSYIGPSGTPAHDEIDFEILLKDTSKVQAGGYVSGKTVEVQLADLPRESNKGFIDYAYVWEPNKVSYYVDKKLVYEIEPPAPLPEHAQKMFFSLWGTDTLTDWLGPMEPIAGPLTMQVDWVGFTAPGQSCLFPASITC